MSNSTNLVVQHLLANQTPRQQKANRIRYRSRFGFQRREWLVDHWGEACPTFN